MATFGFFNEPSIRGFASMNIVICFFIGTLIFLRKNVRFRYFFTLVSFSTFYFALPVLNLIWFFLLTNPDFSIGTRFYSSLIFVPQIVPILLMGYARLLRWPERESLPWSQRETAWRISASGILVFLIGCLYTFWLMGNFGGADLHE